MSLPSPRFDFASDTVSAMCPEAIEALAAANSAPYTGSYGDDPWSMEAERLIADYLGRECAVHFVPSGTAANAFALSLLVRPEQAVFCHSDAHIEVDEANAPEFFTGGSKIVTVPGPNGKILPDSVRAVIARRGRGYHSAEPSAISLTQTTECGTIYAPAEIRALASLKETTPGLKMHMDGARFANAAAASGCARDLVEGVDVLCLGGSKNGGAPSEAIVTLDPELIGDGVRTERTRRRLKRAGLLPAKMRFFAAPWIGLLRGDAYLRYAKHANDCARELAAEFARLGYELAVPVESNQVFVKLPAPAVERLGRSGWRFYPFPSVGGYRFVCNWNTESAAIRQLAAELGDR